MANPFLDKATEFERLAQEHLEQAEPTSRNTTAQMDRSVAKAQVYATLALGNYTAFTVNPNA